MIDSMNCRKADWGTIDDGTVQVITDVVADESWFKRSDTGTVD